MARTQNSWHSWQLMALIFCHASKVPLIHFTQVIRDTFGDAYIIMHDAVKPWGGK